MSKLLKVPLKFTLNKIENKNFITIYLRVYIILKQFK